MLKIRSIRACIVRIRYLLLYDISYSYDHETQVREATEALRGPILEPRRQYQRGNR